MCFVLMIASSTTGYDGTLINVSQQIQRWEEFFGADIDDNNKLGLLVNMFNIGSIVSFFFTPYVADIYGRKFAIMIGCILMISGGCLTAFCDGYMSRSNPDKMTQVILTDLRKSVCQRKICPWIRELVGADGLAAAPHRNMPPTTSGTSHRHI